MSHVVYSEQQLVAKSLEQLKALATQLGCTPEGDKRRKDAWVQAIVNHQSTQIQQVAQAELNQYIEQQAQEVTEITSREITFYDHEVLADDEVIAEIHHDADDFVTQRWVVTVSGQEQHRADTWQKCYGYVCLHHKGGTLPKHEVSQPQSDNAVIAQLTESYAQAEIDAVPDSDFGNLYRVWQGMQILGTFYESMSGDWVARSCGSTESWYCSSPEDAMHQIIEDTSDTTQTTLGEIPHMSYESTLITELLDKPFDEVTSCEWRILQNYELPELVVA